MTKAASQLIVVKWIALNFGPATLGVTGQAMSLIAITQAMAGGGIANGVIRRFAIDAEDPVRSRQFISASFTYGLFFSGLFMIVGTLLAPQISVMAFDTPDYTWFVFLLGFSCVFSFFTVFSQSLLSAKSSVKNIFCANALGLTCGVIIFAVLTHNISEPGILWGLLAMIAMPTVFFSIQLAGKSWFSFRYLKPQWNHDVKRALVPFTLIAVIGSALAPLIFVMLRTGIEDKMGWDYVGYWQAILKIPDFIYSFIGLFIASTFFPRVSAAKTADEALRSAIRFVIPFSLALAVGMFTIGLFGEQVLSLVFSDAYRFLHSNLNVLLFGSFFRVLAWLATFFLMARNHLKLFLTFEVIGSASLYGICRYSLNSGFDALIWGQVIQSVFYLTILTAGIAYMKLTNRLR